MNARGTEKRGRIRTYPHAIDALCVDVQLVLKNSSAAASSAAAAAVPRPNPAQYYIAVAMGELSPERAAQNARADAAATVHWENMLPHP